MDASALRSAPRWEAGPICSTPGQRRCGKVYGMNHLRDDDDPRGGLWVPGKEGFYDIFFIRASRCCPNQKVVGDHDGGLMNDCYR